jgi:hypothetical protein
MSTTTTTTSTSSTPRVRRAVDDLDGARERGHPHARIAHRTSRDDQSTVDGSRRGDETWRPTEFTISNQ